MQPAQQQPAQQQPARKPKTVRLKYEYGETDLNIIGDPNRVFDIPIAYYSSPVFCPTLIDSEPLDRNKIFEAYAKTAHLTQSARSPPSSYTKQFNE